MSLKLYKKAQRINVRNQRAEKMAQHPDWGSESRLSMIQMLIPLGLQAVQEELQAEVRWLVGGSRHDRTGRDNKRWGQNPGSVFLVLPGSVWVEAETTAMEKDGDPVFFEISEAASIGLNDLNFGIESLGHRVRDAVTAVG